MAKHDTMKDAIRRVIRDLKQELQLVHQQNADERSTIEMTVDLTIQHARRHLRKIGDAFETAGRDVEWKGEAPSHESADACAATIYSGNSQTPRSSGSLKQIAESSRFFVLPGWELLEPGTLLQPW